MRESLNAAIIAGKASTATTGRAPSSAMAAGVEAGAAAKNEAARPLTSPASAAIASASRRRCQAHRPRHKRCGSRRPLLKIGEDGGHAGGKLPLLLSRRHDPPLRRHSRSLMG